jgi:hypothetical protein
MGSRPPNTCSIADLPSLEKLGFELWTGDIRLSCREVQWEVQGLCAPWKVNLLAAAD